jgi:biopolymer transport protein TolR
MASMNTGGSGKNVNVDLNLVPFIDLMSVMITFMLLTAVWTQISMIQMGSSIYGKKNVENDTKPPPKSEIPFRIDDDYDLVALKGRVENIKRIHPEKEDVVLTMDDEIIYDELIRGMDILLQSGFPSVSVATGGTK